MPNSTLPHANLFNGGELDSAVASQLAPVTVGKAATEYAELRRIVETEGLLKGQPVYYGLRFAAVLGALAAGVWLALTLQHAALLLIDAAFLGLLCTQVEMLGHDVGHRQVFRSRRSALPLGLLLGPLLLGVSASWWTAKHNRHHAAPNHIEQDPDVMYAMLVFSPEQIEGKRRVLRPLIAFQAFLFPLLLPFQPLTMRWQSLRLLRTKQLPVEEVLGIAVNGALCWALLSHLGSWQLALSFAAVHQAALGLYNGAAFAPNHKGMPMVTTNSSRGSYLHEQICTARNIRGHPVTDFAYGGLNYQIEHHLFPYMPQNKLKQARLIVREFCEARSIGYYETGVARSYREVFAHMHRASAPLRQRAAWFPAR